MFLWCLGCEIYIFHLVGQLTIRYLFLWIFVWCFFCKIGVYGKSPQNSIWQAPSGTLQLLFDCRRASDPSSTCLYPSEVPREPAVPVFHLKIHSCFQFKMLGLGLRARNNQIVIIQKGFGGQNTRARSVLSHLWTRFGRRLFCNVKIKGVSQSSLII